MGEFVGDEGDQALVASEYGWRQERQLWILHAAIGKAWRQHKHVVTSPAVGPVEFLGRPEHGFHVAEFPGGALNDPRLAINPGARPHLAELHITHRQGDQIGRDRLRHFEGVVAIAEAAGRRIDPREVTLEQEVLGEAVAEIAPETELRVAAKSDGCRSERYAKPLVLCLYRCWRQKNERRQRHRGDGDPDYRHERS